MHAPRNIFILYQDSNGLSALCALEAVVACHVGMYGYLIMGMGKGMGILVCMYTYVGKGIVCTSHVRLTKWQKGRVHPCAFNFDPLAPFVSERAIK